MGGVVNTTGGSLDAGGIGIEVGAVSSFSGGIINNGLISAATYAISLASDGSFSGGISNSGTLSASAGGHGCAERGLHFYK